MRSNLCPATGANRSPRTISASTPSRRRFSAITAQASALTSASVTRACGQSFAKLSPMAPLPAHRSSTRGDALPCKNASAASQSVSVSCRGMSTRLST